MDINKTNIETKKIDQARQAASSAISSAFNTVVTHPVNTIKNNLNNNSSINRSNNESINDDPNENATTTKTNESEKTSHSNKFLQVFTLKKVTNIISSLPANSQKASSAVLHKINPFESSQSLDLPKTPKEDSKVKRFIFSHLSIDRTDRTDYSTYEYDENYLPETEEDLTEQEMLEQSNNKEIENGDAGLINRTSSLKRKQPAGSLEYTVCENETVEKIALKWNTIPSEIMRMNRLVTRTIFPGQKIYVPDPNYVAPPEEPKSPAQILKKQLSLGETSSPNKPAATTEQSNSGGGGFSFLRWKTNSKPGHAEPQKPVEVKDSSNRRGSLNRQLLSEDDAKKLDEECMQRFLKINCKIVTRTKGCYDGVLIVTPSALMFDPFEANTNSNSNNNSVMNSSPDISSAAITTLNESSESCSNETPNNNTKQRTTSTSSSNSIYDEASAIIPIESISNLIMYEDLALRDLQDYFEHQENKDLDKSGSVFSENKSPQASSVNANEKKNHQRPRKTSASSNHVTFNLDATENIIVIEENNIVIAETNNENTTNTYENTIDNSMSNLLIDEAANNTSDELNKGELIKNCENQSTSDANSDLNSCYLCVKVNNNKDFLMCPLNRKMKNRLKSEFWFQIKDKSNDKIYAFFLEWKSDPTFSQSTDESSQSTTTTRRFQVIKQNQSVKDLVEDSLKSSLNKDLSSTNQLFNKFNSFTKDWEMVNLQELELKLRVEKEIENEYKNLPHLMNESLILKEEHLRKLNVNLIARAIGYNWVLSFSTEEHGFSLNTLYRKLADIDGPCLIVVKDTHNNIFGAMSSTKLYQSEHFYGSGESFLFTFWPSFKVYKWTGENAFFTRGTNESISFGCGDGNQGLWFDSDLLNGHTQRTKTYDNDMLTDLEYFTIASLEVWTFNDEI